MKRCIENNDQIIKLIIKDVAHIFENVCPTTAQVDNVRDVYLPSHLLLVKCSLIINEVINYLYNVIDILKYIWIFLLYFAEIMLPI